MTYSKVPEWLNGDLTIKEPWDVKDKVVNNKVTADEHNKLIKDNLSDVWKKEEK